MGGIGLASNTYSLIKGNEILLNHTETYGGGIRIYDYSSATISDNTISLNTAYNGGGICCYSSSLVLKENRISSNSAEEGEDIYGEYFSSPVVHGDNDLDPNKTYYDGLSYATQSPMNPWGEIYGATLFEGTSGMGIDLCIKGDYAYFLNQDPHCRSCISMIPISLL